MGCWHVAFLRLLMGWFVGNKVMIVCCCLICLDSVYGAHCVVAEQEELYERVNIVPDGRNIH
jgi:hypothetical protein